MAMTTLQWPDYLILVLFLVISLGIGVYHSLTGGRQRTTQEFVMANRQLSIIPTTISLFVSFQSAITVLGSTAEMYLYGVIYLVWAPIGFLVAVLIAERLIVPWIYPLKLLSVNDYLERRYDSKAIRVLGSAMGVVSAIFYTGIAVYAPSAALENATGLPISVSIPLMSIVAITYTSLGGMRAVIWTDVFQFVTMTGGMLAIMIKGMVVMGGFSNVLAICGREGRLQTVDWSLDPTVRHTVWGFIFGAGISWAKVYGLSQASVQRYSATPTLAKARATVLINTPAVWASYFICCATGLTVFAYYSTIRCDPLVNKDVQSANQLLSLFVMTIFSNAHGFAGLFLATLYGGALSSVSSSLSGAAANLWDDILKIWLSGMTEQRKALTNRLLVILVGAVAMAIAFAAAVIPGPITQITIAFSSSVNGPITGLFVLGGISRRANWKGAMIGTIVSLVACFWLTIGAFSLKTKHPPLPPTSVDGCIARNVTWYNETDALLDLDYDDYVTTSANYLLNASSTVLTPAVNSTKASISELTGTARFYSLSYLWYSMFGVLITMTVGTMASFIFRDEKAEEKVDDCLLIPFRQCLTWNGREETTSELHNGEYIAVRTNSMNKGMNNELPFQEVIHVNCVTVIKTENDPGETYRLDGDGEDDVTMTSQ